MISATDEGDLETVFGLAKLLKKEAKTAAAAAVAGAVVKRVACLGGSDPEAARARSGDRDQSLALVIKVLGAFKGCAEQEDLLACQRMARARAEALGYEKPQPSNRQPYAKVPGHPEVTKFFHRDGCKSQANM